jgi:quinoprotein glucose dehydrogenase
MRRPTPRTALLALVLGLLGSATGTSGQSTPGPSTPGPSTRNGEWPHYTADLRGTKYSPLDQIDARNFNQLEVAWRFKTDSLGTRPEYKLEGTPLMVGGTLYTTGGTRRSVVALDAQSGELLWVHRYPEGARGAAAPRQLSGRGVAYWTDGRGDERVLYVTPGYRLIALNAKTGVPVPSFGKNGVVDLKARRRLRRREADRSRERRDRPALHADHRQGHHHRGLVDEGRHDHRDPQQHQGAGARLRRPHRQAAVDVQHDPAARRAGQRHLAERIVGRQRQRRRVDADHGGRGTRPRLPAGGIALVRLLRRQAPGKNLYGESLVCVDLKTGQRKWHFQLVHHPIWDHDISSAPILLDVTLDGKPRKLVAQPSKQSFLYVFDRVTGEPIWPIVETPVPTGDVPGEWYAPTQPIPTRPAPYGRPGLKIPDEVIDFTPELRAQAMENLKHYKWGGNFPSAARSTTRPSSATSPACSAPSTSGTPAAARTGPAPAPIPRPASSTRRPTCPRSAPNRWRRRPPASRTSPIKRALSDSRSGSASPRAPARMPTSGSRPPSPRRPRPPAPRQPAYNAVEGLSLVKPPYGVHVGRSTCASGA